LQAVPMEIVEDGFGDVEASCGLFGAGQVDDIFRQNPVLREKS